jgi:NADH-quinone oxidoreductase subunit F
VTGGLERPPRAAGGWRAEAYAPAVPLLDLVPRSFRDYEAAGGGRGLQTALASWPQEVIDEVARSGLRGRGGAGFPTGEKWRSVRAVGAGPRFAVCNAAEGEPATFKDRLLLRTNPYQVLEGLAIAAYAVGAERAYVGLKEVFTPEIQTLSRALQEMREADALGGVPVEIVLGPDLYLFGEETGLEEVIEGRLPLPRVARPFIQGLFARPPQDNPTVVNNVETLANVPHIVAEGANWLRANGPESAPGTMLFTICGDVRREGVLELPLGTPLRYLVEELAGGPPEGRTVKAIFPGASSTVILPAQLDTPMDFDSMRQMGSGLGAGGFAVFDDSACMVQAAFQYSRFLFVESCGQCPACKFGTGEVTGALRAIEAGGGSDRDIDLIVVRARGSTGGQKCALPTGESLLMQSVVQVFGDEIGRHIGTPCPLPRELPFHKIVDWDAQAGRFSYDLAYEAKQPDWAGVS